MADMLSLRGVEKTFATGAQALNPEDLYFSLIEGVGGE